MKTDVEIKNTLVKIIPLCATLITCFIIAAQSIEIFARSIEKGLINQATTADAAWSIHSSSNNGFWIFNSNTGKICSVLTDTSIAGSCLKKPLDLNW